MAQSVLVLPPMTAANASAIILRQGTAVRMMSDQLLTSKNNHVGDRFELHAAEDVKIGDLTVILAGSRGVGEVTHVEKKGAFGKSGKLETKIIFVRVGATEIRLGGQMHNAGDGGTVGVVVAAVLLWPLAPFVTGKSAEITAGTVITGYTEGDIQIGVAAAAQAQAVVAASQGGQVLMVAAPVTAAAMPSAAPLVRPK